MRHPTTSAGGEAGEGQSGGGFEIKEQSGIVWMGGRRVRGDGGCEGLNGERGARGGIDGGGEGGQEMQLRHPGPTAKEHDDKRKRDPWG